MQPCAPYRQAASSKVQLSAYGEHKLGQTPGMLIKLWLLLARQALYERQTDFFDENVWGMARPQIAAALARLAADAAGVPAFELERALGMQSVEVHGANPGTRVTQDLKFAVKYSRQLGVHVSPTTTLNGLLFDSSSGWGLDKWAGALDPLLEAGALSRLDV